jgi:hypothetical protein
MNPTEFVMVIEKWQMRSEPKWVYHGERKVIGKLTAKRVLITSGIDKGKKFDRGTGCEIKKSDPRSWYRHTLRDWEIKEAS